MKDGLCSIFIHKTSSGSLWEFSFHGDRALSLCMMFGSTKCFNKQGQVLGMLTAEVFLLQAKQFFSYMKKAGNRNKVS